MTETKTALLIFSKVPVLGQVKTRLQPELSQQTSLNIHKKLLRRTLTTVSALHAIADMQLWCAPVISHAFLQALAEEFNLSLHQQQGKDLGERMLFALKSALQNHDNVIIIGCDCPQLDDQDVTLANTKLNESYDVVIGPASDGGYYLIALSAVHATLFHDIDWSTNRVLAQTDKKIHQQALRCFRLAEKDDLDRPEDYARFKHLFIQH